VRLEQAKIVIPQLFEPKLSEYEGVVCNFGRMESFRGVRVVKAKEQKLTSATN